MGERQRETISGGRFPDFRDFEMDGDDGCGVSHSRLPSFCGVASLEYQSLDQARPDNSNYRAA